MRCAVAAVQDQARHHFEGGYRMGLRNVPDLGWGAIELLADHNWDFSTWLRSLKGDTEYDSVYEKLVERFLEDGPASAPGSAARLGFVRALRDVWEAVSVHHDHTTINQQPEHNPA